MAAKAKRSQHLSNILILLGVIIIIGILCFFLVKFTTPHYSQALARTYTGEFPCADCSGISTTLMLTKSSEDKGTYILSEFYEGKPTAPIMTRGNWFITQGTPTNPDAFVLTLTQNNSSENTYYLIEDASKLTMLTQRKEKINSPFNESLTATSTKYQIQSTEMGTKIANQLPSWMPTVTWSEQITSNQQTFYGNLAGSEVTGIVTTKEASVPHFENVKFLQSLQFEPDINLSADGPGSSSWGYIKEVDGKKQIVIFSYRTQPTSTNPNQPIQFACPCQTKLAVFTSNYFLN
ncbi:MAG TPA: copper resistance protein NlpE [Candidatus Saccharimonadales bacterium]|nr:copper resistance protein NlpE [Candidatus Saccharimonadales bacterium]